LSAEGGWRKGRPGFSEGKCETTLLLAWKYVCEKVQYRYMKMVGSVPLYLRSAMHL